MKPSAIFFKATVSTLLIATFFSCNENFGDITFTEESQEAIVMGSGGGLLDMLPTNNLLPPLRLEIDLQEELDSQNAGPAKAVYLDALSLTITPTAMPEGDTDNFDFIDKVDVFVESTKSGSTLSKKQVAVLENVPENQSTVDFTVIEDVDLKPYIEEGVRLTTSGSGEVPPDDTSFKAIVTIRAELL